MHFFKGRQRLGRTQVVYYCEILVKVGKQKDREIEPALVHLQLGLLQVALLCLILDLRFQHIRVGDFPTLLQLLADAQKVFGFGRGPLRGGIFSLCDQVSVIRLHHRDHQPPCRNLRLGPRYCFCRRRSPVLSVGLCGKRLVHIALCDVFMHAVVSDKDWGIARSPISLGIEILHVVAEVGKQRGPALHYVLMGYTQFRQCCLKLWIVGSRPMQGITQCQRQGRIATGAARSGSARLLCHCRN